MTPTPPSTTSSSMGGQSPEVQYRVVRKRNRVPLSCAPCRHRKLKCDRSHPCGNCEKRGDGACSYAAPNRKKSQSAATTPDDMQDRINRLEGLVLSLMTNGSSAPGPTAATAAVDHSQSDSTSPSFKTNELEGDDDMIKEEEEDAESDVEGVATSLGALKVDPQKGQTMYFGDAHWHLVLADIAEVKAYFASHKKEFETGYKRVQALKAPNNGVFVLGSHPPASDDELRSDHLPPKSDIDKLITRFFNTFEPALHIIHAPTFQEDLIKFWKAPAKTSIVWVGLLYSILCLAMRSFVNMSDEPIEWIGRTKELGATFSLRAAQCLKNSDFTKPSQYTIETLILYLNGEYSGGADEVALGAVVSLIVRLSQRQGYHRDAKLYPSLSEFEGEMRRRVWSYIRHLDSLYAYNLGLPCMVKSLDCDAELPRNVYEDEIGPDKPLPPPRSRYEPTQVSFFLVKSELAREFSRVLEMVSSANNRDIHYDDIMNRDRSLSALKENMPPHLRIQGDAHDPSYLLMQRFTLDIEYQKTMCVLHKKYLARARSNSKYTHSRRACVEAALQILRYHSILHRESKPNGRLYAYRFYVASITRADYLLSGMLLALELYHSMSAPDSFWTLDQLNEMLDLLTNSQAIWKEGADSKVEAYKASQLLGVMLDKLREMSGSQATVQNNMRSFVDGSAGLDQAKMKPEYSAAMALGSLSGGISPDSTTMFNNMGAANLDSTMVDPMVGMPSGYDPIAGIGAMPMSAFNDPTELDWAAWDSYIQNGGGLDPNFQFYPADLDISSVPTGESQQTLDSSLFNNGAYTGGSSSTGK